MKSPGRVTRSSSLFAMAAVSIALALLWAVKHAPSEFWKPVQSNALASLELEQALYESPDSPHFFVRFRITNKTRRTLAVYLPDRHEAWPALYPYQWTLAEGDHRGVVSEMKPILLPVQTDPGEKQLLLPVQTDPGEKQLAAAFKAGKAMTLPPLSTLEYYSASAFGSRTEINRSYAAAPLWMKSKTYLPRGRWPLHFIFSVRGTIPVTDGALSKSLTMWGSDDALRFPLRWKQVPAGARIMNIKP